MNDSAFTFMRSSFLQLPGHGRPLDILIANRHLAGVFLFFDRRFASFPSEWAYSAADGTDSFSFFLDRLFIVSWSNDEVVRGDNGSSSIR